MGSLYQLRAFVGNPDVYAVQLDDGSYRPVREPLDGVVLLRHLGGKATIGTYVLWNDKARFIVWDVDERPEYKPLAMAQRIAAIARKHGLIPFIEFSGKKGYHVWALLEEWVPAGQALLAGRYIASEAGFTGEVFPKQAKARDLGNLVKLPFALHRVSKRRSYFLEVLPYEVPLTPVKAVFDLALLMVKRAAETAPQEGGTGAFFCVDSIQEDPPKPGERNVLLFHFACFLRRYGYNDMIVRAALNALVPEEDLDYGEMDRIVENSRYSGPTCDQLPENRRCAPEDCVKTRVKGGPRAGYLRNAAEGETVTLRVAKRVEGSNILELEHPDAEMAKVALKAMEEGDGD
jgi:hypothetical protein